MTNIREPYEEILAELETCQPGPDASIWKVHIDPPLPNASAFVMRMKQTGATAHVDLGPVALTFDREIRVAVAKAMAPTQTAQSIGPFRSRLG